MTQDKRPTRVLFLSSCINGGGAGRSLTVYLNHEGENVEAHVVMPEPGVIEERIEKNVKKIWYVKEFVERIQRCPYAWVEKLGWTWLHWLMNFFALPIATARIICIARRIKPDIIYCNHMLANPVGAFVGTWLKIPVVFHARNIHVAWLGRKFYRFLAGLSCTRRVICNSLASALIYREYTEEKVSVIYNFVDLSEFDRSIISPLLRKSYNIPEDALVIGYLGRILKKKGIHVLLNAFARIYATNPKAYLVLVGDNDGALHHDMRARCEAYAKNLEISDRTFFVGFKEDIRPYLADFDILTLPSVEPESFGRVLIEAMAVGIPSVVSAHGGAVEVVKHGLNGLWSIPGDYDDLARQLDTLLSDADLRQRLGRFGMDHVREQFSESELARRITEVLNEVRNQKVFYFEKRRKQLSDLRNKAHESKSKRRAS